MIPLFSYLFTSPEFAVSFASYTRGPSYFRLFLFWLVLGPFSRIFKATASATLGTGESLKRVPWWVPFALAQLPAPSVNWSFKPDTPRRHCDRSFYIFPPSRFTYTRLFFPLLLLRRTYCKYMYAVALPHHPLERFSRCAPAPKFINQLPRLFLYEICQPLVLLLVILFFLLLSFLYFQWRNGFFLSLDRRCIATDNRISALDGTYN